MLPELLLPLYDPRTNAIWSPDVTGEGSGGNGGRGDVGGGPRPRQTERVGDVEGERETGVDNGKEVVVGFEGNDAPVAAAVSCGEEDEDEDDEEIDRNRSDAPVLWIDGAWLSLLRSATIFPLALKLKSSPFVFEVPTRNVDKYLGEGTGTCVGGVGNEARIEGICH